MVLSHHAHVSYDLANDHITIHTLGIDLKSVSMRKSGKSGTADLKLETHVQLAHFLLSRNKETRKFTFSALDFTCSVT